MTDDFVTGSIGIEELQRRQMRNVEELAKARSLNNQREFLDRKQAGGPSSLEQDEYTVKNGQYQGLKIKLRWINPMLIQTVQNSVKMPKPPMYETTTRSGRVEEWPMDEAAAKETPGGQARWEYYVEQRQEALAVQNERVLRVIFTEGTRFDVPEDGWWERDAFYGIEVPTHPDLRRAHFCIHHLPPEDMTGLMAAIMRNTGVPEEAVAEAEASFQREVRGEQGSTGLLADAGRHPKDLIGQR